MMSDKPVAVCPKCHEESFEIDITDTGSFVHSDYGVGYWWEGDGKCTNCGHESFYSDSSI